MYRQSIIAGFTTVIGLATLIIGGTASADTMAIPNSFTQGTPAVAAEVNQNFNAAKTAVDDNFSRIQTNETNIGNNFSLINDNASNISNNFSALDQRINRVETGNLDTVAVDCVNDSTALKNTVFAPNTEYVLTGVCDGQVAVEGTALGTIVIKGDATGIKDDGITLQPGETDPNTIFAAIYGLNGVNLFLENLTITASAYNSTSDLFIGAVGSYQGAQVILNDVAVVGGDYGVGVYNTAFASIDGSSSVTGFSLNGLRSERASVIRVFNTLNVAGANNSDHFGSEGLAAYSGGVIVFDDDGNANTSHSITAASGPNIGISPDDNVAAVSAWQNGVIRMRDADIDGVVWSGDSSVVDLRNVFQENGYLNPYRNSILRFNNSNIGNGTADDMTIYSGDFSVFRADNTTVGNLSNTETASTYRYGVIDLRGTTNFGGRDIFCSDGREVAIRTGVTNVGSVSCLPPP